MYPILFLVLSIFFLLGVVAVAGLKTALQRLGSSLIEQQIASRPHIFPLFYALRCLDSLFFILSLTVQLSLLLYITFAISLKILTIPYLILIILLPIVLIFSIRSLAEIKPNLIAKASGVIASIYFFLFFPLTYALDFARKFFLHKAQKEEGAEATKRLKYKILELIQETEIAEQIEPYDRRLISSVASFRERIVREIMVPRINVLSLSSDLTIAEAAKSMIEEEYSRVPVYESDVDHIIGVLLFKDLLSFYVKNDSLDSPIKEIIKPIIYTPETKRISKLLQEFRSKQIHLAIVVDEYGGTEGIVTIEDILEELVGEIADEYDYDETALFTPETEGGWTVDAKMNIVDIEKELKIQIPKSPEYDTIGGYLFHKAGTIPLPGFRLHHDNFDLVVVSSDERSVDKVRIIPL